MRMAGNTFANSATAEFRFSMPNINQSKSWADLVLSPVGSAIPGVWRWIPRATFMLPIPRIIEFRSSCGREHEFLVRSSLLPACADSGAGVGDLVCLEDRCAGQFLAPVDSFERSAHRAARAGFRHC